MNWISGAEIMLRRKVCWRIWTLFYCVLMRLWMAGMLSSTLCFVQSLFLFCPAFIVRSSHRFSYHRSCVICFISGSTLWKDIANFY